jgi:hypothetical protein
MGGAAEHTGLLLRKADYKVTTYTRRHFRQNLCKLGLRIYMDEYRNYPTNFG